MQVLRDFWKIVNFAKPPSYALVRPVFPNLITCESTHNNLKMFKMEIRALYLSKAAVVTPFAKENVQKSPKV